MNAISMLRAALPTNRHAEMLMDALIAGLGDRAFVEHSAGGSETRVFARDCTEREWIIPWPYLQYVRDRRLGFIMGAGGPPSYAVPPAGDESPLKLKGLAGGELEFQDGRIRFTLTYGEDGRLRETTRAESEAHLAAVAEALDSRRGNDVERLADYLIGVDMGALGPGRLRLTGVTTQLAMGTWDHALDGLRDAVLDSGLGIRDLWIAVDGYAAAVVRTGPSLEEAYMRCREAIEIERPRPPEPGPLPTPEQLAEVGIQNCVTMGNPDGRGPVVEPTPENTPVGATAVIPLPDSLPPFGAWVRVLDQRGGSRLASMLVEPGGHLFASPVIFDLSTDVEHLHELLDEADLEYDRLSRFSPPTWPSWLPKLRSEVRTYSLEADPGGSLRARAKFRRKYPFFSGRAIPWQDLVSGIARQRFLD